MVELVERGPARLQIEKVQIFTYVFNMALSCAIAMAMNDMYYTEALSCTRMTRRNELDWI